MVIWGIILWVWKTKEEAILTFHFGILMPQWTGVFKSKWIIKAKVFYFPGTQQYLVEKRCICFLLLNLDKVLTKFFSGNVCFYIINEILKCMFLVGIIIIFKINLFCVCFLRREKICWLPLQKFTYGDK